MLRATSRPLKTIPEQVRALNTEALLKRRVIHGLLREMDERNKIKPIRGKPLR